jgi:uncharacterized protein YodC (DUF2158 family)
MEFRIGDVVQLKSGGPRMTVDFVDTHGALTCIWFEGQERRSQSFQPETLRPAEFRESALPVSRRSSWGDARRGYPSRD